MAVIVAVFDFAVDVGSAEGAGYRVRARSPDGREAAGTMRLRRAELDVLAARIPDAVVISSVAVRRAAPVHELPVRRLGGMLYEALFTGGVRGLFAAARDAVDDGGQLRLVLQVEPPELASLPWEFLFDPDEGDYLCVATPLIRRLPLPRPVPPLPVAPPLRVLAMAARPGDRGALAVDTEHDLLRGALAPLGEAGRIELGWVAGQTWRALRDAIRDDGPWHVLHFIGHGGFDRETGEGELTLADETGRAFSLRASDLVLLLKNHRSLRLVVLNACDTGRGSALEPFSSVAGALLRTGIPAVLAMQSKITDTAAIEFSRTFYAGIAQRRPVDVAVTDARQAIRIEIPGTLEWGTPVLYLRSPDGHIFDLTGPPAASGPPARANDTAGVPARSPALLRSFDMTWNYRGGAFSPDGTAFALYDEDRIRVMEIASGEERFSIPTGDLGAGIGNVTFDADGRRLATSGPGASVWVWDATDGTRLSELPHPDHPAWVAFSPDGTRIATADWTASRIWDAATGAELLTLGSGASGRVMFSPDGTRIATVNSSSSLWDSATGAECRRFIHTWDVAFSLDGTRIATAGADGVRIYRMADIDGHANELREIGKIPQAESTFHVAFSPYGTRIATAGINGITQVWDLTNGGELHRITHDDDDVIHLEFSPDGSRLATATQGMDRVHRQLRTRIWDLRGTS